MRPQFLLVPQSWRLRIFKCCEYHRLSIQIGPLIWRWQA